MPPRPRLLAPAVAALVAIVVVLVVVLSSSSGGGSTTTTTLPGATDSVTGFDGAGLPGDVHAPAFALRDQQGRRVSLGQYRGQVVILTFLYSTCGDTCIVIAQQIRGTLNELPRPVPVLIVSADPGADTPTRVRRFLSSVSLSGRVEYLTGQLSQLQPIWRAYRVTPASAGAREFDRFASVLLIDPSGRERVVYQEEELTPESLTHDIGKLQDP